MSRTLIDHDSIREWAEHHGAHPASVRGTGQAGDAGIIRLDFEGYSGAESLAPVDWDTWFRTFDDRQLALIVDDRGTAPNFNKLVARESAAGTSSGHAGRRASRDDLRAQDVDEDEEPSDMDDEDEDEDVDGDDAEDLDDEGDGDEGDEEEDEFDDDEDSDEEDDGR
jgi:hypothetical protein